MRMRRKEGREKRRNQIQILAQLLGSCVTLREFSRVPICTVEMVYLQCTRGSDWPGVQGTPLTTHQINRMSQAAYSNAKEQGTVFVKASIPHPLTVPSVNMVS